MNAIAMTGPCTSSIARSAASRGDIPCSSMLACTASVTTIASSTTRPMASTSPKSVVMLMLNPNIKKAAKVPTTETGTVRSGMSVARQFCRKTNTTSSTRMIASIKVRTTSSIEARTKAVVSKLMT